VSDEERFSATVWGMVALGAVALGFGLAFLGGYFLGHFTGHTKTTTVAASEAGETTAPPEEAPKPETRAETEAKSGGGETTKAEEKGGGEGGSEGGGGKGGGAAQIEEGEQVFTASGCGSCHTLAAAGASGTVGPDLDEVLPGKSAAFIDESIVNPDAQIAPGYAPGIMPSNFKSSLSSSELEALVAFLKQEAGK
jgi:cytochrome c551/c552